MLTLRRTHHEARLEIMPLIDVIFLLLTFFIYAMVLMIRADTLPLRMPVFASGEPARPVPAVTITIDGMGALYYDRAPITLDDVPDRVRAAKAENPATVIYIATEEEGSVDRLPTFLALYDRLVPAGLDIKLVGRSPDGEPSAISDQPSAPRQPR